MKNHRNLRPRDGAGQLAERLTHETRLQANMRVAHVTLDFRFRYQRRDGIDHDHINRARTHEDFTDLERLLTSIGLRDQQVLDVNAQLLAVLDVQRMLGIDVGSDASLLLGIRHNMQAQRCLAAGLRSVNLGHASARNSTNADRRIKIDRTGGDGLHTNFGVGTESHDRSLSTTLFDLRDCERQGLALVVCHHCARHGKPPS